MIKKLFLAVIILLFAAVILLIFAPFKRASIGNTSTVDNPEARDGIEAFTKKAISIFNSENKRDFARLWNKKVPKDKYKQALENMKEFSAYPLEIEKVIYPEAEKGKYFVYAKAPGKERCLKFVLLAPEKPDKEKPYIIDGILVTYL